LPDASLTDSDAVIVVSSARPDKLTVEATAVPPVIVATTLVVPSLNTTVPLSSGASPLTAKPTAPAPAEPTATVEPLFTVNAACSVLSWSRFRLLGIGAMVAAVRR
jgi:hypothetical protein